MERKTILTTRLVTGLLGLGLTAGTLSFCRQSEQVPVEASAPAKASPPARAAVSDDPPPPKTGELVPTQAAHDYMVNALDADGRFTYRINLERERPSSKYNVLRHAGAVYALGDHYNRHGDPTTQEAIDRATGYLVRRYIRPVEGHEDLVAVFSRPGEETLGTGKPEAKLGGAALGLLALQAAKNAGSTHGDLEMMQGLARFMLFMQREDGTFHSKYSESKGFLSFESLYYPGEAILALVHQYEVDGDQRWLDGAARGTAALVRARKGMKRLPADHWLLIAIEPLLKHYDALEVKPIPAHEIQQHALALGKTMVKSQEKAARGGAPVGSFNVQARCTPAATRLEGLAALRRSMQDWADPADQREIQESFDQGLEFVLGCQVKEGRGKGGILRARNPGNGIVPDDRQKEIRIDYVQHALSAMNAAPDLLRLTATAPVGR